jgi:ABC-type phosphate transport system permease subunit
MMGSVLLAFAAAIVILTLALGFGVWLEQGGKSEDEDYDDY